MENLEKNWNKNKILSTIIETLKDNELSIADIQRKTDMKRSTLIYYLNLLETQGLIKKRRVEKKKTGRPTMIRIPENKISEMKRRTEKSRGYTIEILKELKKRGEMNMDEFHTLVPFNPTREGWKERFNATLHLQFSNLTDKIIRVSGEGKKFLKENGKSSCKFKTS